MSTKLHETKDRDESHKLLEQVLATGVHPRAECREADGNGFYSVWSGPMDSDGQVSPVSPVALASTAILDPTRMHPADLAALADAVAARLKGG